MAEQTLWTIVMIELAVFLVVLLVVAWVLMRRAKVQLTQQLQTTQAQVLSLQQQLLQTRQVDVAAVVNQVVAEIENYKQQLQQLAAMNQLQRKLIAELKNLSGMEKDSAASFNNMTAHIRDLKQRADESDAVINELTDALNNSYLKYDKLHKQALAQQEKIKQLQQQQQHQQQPSSSSSVSETELTQLLAQLEMQDQQLAQLQQQEQQAAKLQLERNKLSKERTQLQQANDAFKRKVIAQGKEIEELTARLQLQPPVHSSAVNEMQQQLLEREQQLNRVQREHDFLEQQFLQLVEHAQSSEQVLAELERVKNEYALLEQRYIRQQAENDTNDTAMPLKN